MEWLGKRDAYVRLCAQIVNFIGLYFVDYVPQTAGVRQITVMKMQRNFFVVGIRVQVFNTAGIKAGTPAHNTMNYVTLAKEKLSEIRPVLTGDSSN